MLFLFIWILFISAITTSILTALPYFGAHFYDDLNKYFPYETYLINAVNEAKPTNNDYTYSDKQPPGLNRKYVILGYILRKENFANCLIYCFLPVLFQFIFWGIGLNIGIISDHISYHKYFEMIVIFDYFILFACSIAMTSLHLARIKKDVMYIERKRRDIELIPNNPNREQAKEQLKDLLLEVRIARKANK